MRVLPAPPTFAPLRKFAPLVPALPFSMVAIVDDTDSGAMEEGAMMLRVEDSLLGGRNVEEKKGSLMLLRKDGNGDGDKIRVRGQVFPERSLDALDGT